MEARGLLIYKQRQNEHREHGGGRLATMLMILVLAAAVFVGFKIFPAYFSNYQLQDSMLTEARFAVSSRKSEEDVRAAVWKKIQELGIPAKREDIKVTFVDTSVNIEVNYVVHVDLKVYEFNLEFHPHADNHTI
jgi:hypothetical protein